LICSAVENLSLNALDGLGMPNANTVLAGVNVLAEEIRTELAMDPIWQRIESELLRRGKDDKWLAAQLRTSHERVLNWQRRTVPDSASMMLRIARVFGWTVDYLMLGGEVQIAIPTLSPQSLKIAQLLDTLKTDTARYAVAYGLLRDQLDTLLGVGLVPPASASHPQATPAPAPGTEKRGA
jgi:hypothetical protein